MITIGDGTKLCHGCLGVFQKKKEKLCVMNHCKECCFCELIQGKELEK